MGNTARSGGGNGWSSPASCVAFPGASGPLSPHRSFLPNVRGRGRRPSPLRPLTPDPPRGFKAGGSRPPSCPQTHWKRLPLHSQPAGFPPAAKDPAPTEWQSRLARFPIRLGGRRGPLFLMCSLLLSFFPSTPGRRTERFPGAQAPGVGEDPSGRTVTGAKAAADSGSDSERGKPAAGAGALTPLLGGHGRAGGCDAKAGWDSMQALLLPTQGPAPGVPLRPHF